MRIAIYSHSIAPSIDGVCRRFTGILHELVNEGHEVILFTLEEEASELPPELLDIVWLDYMFMPAYPDKKVAKPDFHGFFQIVRTLQKYKPDVIHITADGVSQVFALAGMLLGVPVVASFHTDILDLLSSHNANFFQRFCITFKESVDSYVLDSCATTSSSFAKKLLRQGLRTEHVIITGVDTEKFNPDKKQMDIRKELTFGNPDAFLCVYVGRISKEKRMDVMIEAMRGIDNAYLAIIGDGPSASTYAAMHGKENRLYCKPRFLAHAELARIYASSDVHVSASEFETLGNTVLEAFACQAPVVVPRTQGFCDTVTHETNGFLFEPGDPLSARSYLLRLQADSQLRSKMGSKGRLSVADRSVYKVIDDLVKWYQKGADRRKRRGVYGAALRISVLLLSVPFAMCCMAGYELVVYILGIAPPKKKMKSKEK